METKIVNYKKFGKCLCITDGKTEAYITLDIGPRIIKYNCIGMENMLFNDNEIAKFKDVSSLFGEGEMWHTYGGHRTWVSPEKFPDVYYPDNQPVKYEIKNNKVTFTAEEQKVNRVVLRYTIYFDTDGQLVIEHYLTNTDTKPRRGGIWGITVTDINGIAVFTQPEKNSDLLPNRSISYWPYTDLNDKRFIHGKEYVIIQHDPNAETPAKYGFNGFGTTFYLFNKNQLMTFSYPKPAENAVYPDFGVQCEAYLNPAIFELETLSPFYDIAPGQTVTHTEKWSLKPFKEKPEFNEKSVKDIFSKI